MMKKPLNGVESILIFIFTHLIIEDIPPLIPLWSYWRSPSQCFKLILQPFQELCIPAPWDLMCHWILKDIPANVLHCLQCIILTGSSYCSVVSQFCSVLFCLVYLFRQHIDEWPSLCVLGRERLATVPERWELRQLASSHCSKPLPVHACSYYYIVKTTLPECLECLISPFILAAQINTSKQKALRGGRIESIMLYVCGSSAGMKGVWICFFSKIKKKSGDNDVCFC